MKNKKTLNCKDVKFTQELSIYNPDCLNNTFKYTLRRCSTSKKFFELLDKQLPNQLLYNTEKKEAYFLNSDRELFKLKFKPIVEKKKMNVDLSDIYEKYPKQPNNNPMVFYQSGSSVKPHCWKTIWYSDLSHDCRTLIEDLVQSSRVEVVQRWDDNFRREYYTKAIAIAYDLGKEYNKNIFTKFKEWFLGLIKWRTWD